jgi:hypothetical protein
MAKKLIYGAAVLALGVMIMAGCNFGGEGGPLSMEEAVQAGVQATLTKEAWLEGVEAARKTAIASQDASGEQASSGAPAATATPYPTAEPTLTPTLKPASAHQQVPGKPKERVDTYLVDYNSSTDAKEHVTYGDNYKHNILERPFTADAMDYWGSLDIIRVNLKVTDSWIYAIIFLAGDLPASGEMQYGLELDLDENGRGDFLVLSGVPTSTEWSVTGVKVYQDLDKDVGGKSPMYIDKPDPSLNGYETLVFDSGEGDDPDLVWVRRDPDEKTALQFAIKPDLIGNTGYMWSAWADAGLKAPDYRDYHDRFSEETAGSPYPGSPLYPIKNLVLYDSTCRSYFGFTPTGNEPGLCP